MVPSFRLIGRTNPCFGWDGSSLVRDLPSGGPGRLVEGAFAGLGQDAGRAWLARDPLGLGKLFWARSDGDIGEIELASHPAPLVERGHALDDCAALPANVVVTYGDGDGSPVVRPLAEPTGAEPEHDSVDRLAPRIRATVEGYLAELLAARPGPVVVCLSGGLDSTSVAVLARAQRDDVIAVTFDLGRPGSHQRSDDFLAAHAAARHLGLDVVPAVHSPEQLFAQLDTVLVAGIDWRDFNVHAGLVNAGLALSIAELVGADAAETTVLTGDLVNELVADYHSETYEGRTYYRLPRLPVAGLRTALVRGLATGHRELGVFGAFGLAVVQPYAVAREAFLQLPDDVLGPGPGKGRLYRAMFGDELPPSCYERPKTRAQTGSAEGERGVLAACADAGLDEHRLARRFAELHRVDDLGALTRFLRAGRYRSGVPLSTDVADDARKESDS